MNNPLDSLMTKLSWQKNDLSTLLRHAEEQRDQIQNHIEETQKQCEQGARTSIKINPELEINHANFITQVRLKQDSLNRELGQLSEHIDQLNTRLLRTNTELKMLEKYQEQNKEQKRQEQNKLQEIQMDEWAQQRREAV